MGAISRTLEDKYYKGQNAVSIPLLDEQMRLFKQAIVTFEPEKEAAEQKPIRSPFFYVGDKYKLIPQLKVHFPKNINRYFEPFCGGGSVFLNVDADKLYLNDIDSNMISLHKFLYKHRNVKNDFFDKIESYIKEYNLSASYLGQTVPDRLKQEFVKTYYAQYNKKSYLKMRESYNENKNNLVLLYLLLIYGFNRMLRFNSKGDFNLPVGNVDFNLNVKKALLDYFKEVSNKRVVFYSMDFEEFLSRCDLKKGDFVYLDPPYLISFSEYNKFWNVEQEKRLLELLIKLDRKKIKFVISNVIYHKGNCNEIFRNWAQDFNVVNIKSNYISYHDNSEKNSLEVIVKNY